jgi:uncharacterized protein YegP (UPF0339 family)
VWWPVTPTVIPNCTSRSRKDDHGQVRGVQRRHGEFRFRLKASNGQIIASGESYKTKAGVLNGIASIKRNAADAAIIDLST